MVQNAAKALMAKYKDQVFKPVLSALSITERKQVQSLLLAIDHHKAFSILELAFHSFAMYWTSEYLSLEDVSQPNAKKFFLWLQGSSCPRHVQMLGHIVFTELLSVLAYVVQDNFSEADLEKLLNGNIFDPHFTKAVNQLSERLAKFAKTEEIVHPVQSELEVDSFLIELSSLLRELQCPYSLLTSKPLKETLKNRDAKLLVLYFLSSELQAAIMIMAEKPIDRGMQIEIVESDTAKNLRVLLQGLVLSKPPANVTASQLFAKVEPKLREAVSKAPPGNLGTPLLTFGMTEKQWFALQSIYEDLLKEYKMRRETLIKRLDVTIQSFTWSSRVKDKINSIVTSYDIIRGALHPEPRVRLSDLLAARQDLAILEKTSSASVRQKTKSAINRVIIGNVPDRGGRTSEQQAPPAEMPSWQTRKAPPASQGRCHHPHGGRGGGRIQGGWSQDRQQIGGGWGGAQNEGSWGGQGGQNRGEKRGNDDRGGYRGGRGRGGY